MDTFSKTFLVEQDGQIRIICLPGSMSVLAGTEVFAEFDLLLADFHKTGTTEVVIDFARVCYFGSNLLEALLALWKQLLAAQGKMTLCNVSEIGREILNVSRFDTVWPIYASRAQALEAVRCRN